MVNAELEIWTPLPPSKSGIANFSKICFEDHNFNRDINFVVQEKRQIVNSRTKLIRDSNVKIPKLPS